MADTPDVLAAREVLQAAEACDRARVVLAGQSMGPEWVAARQAYYDAEDKRERLAAQHAPALAAAVERLTEALQWVYDASKDEAIADDDFRESAGRTARAALARLDAT